jgi:hypothetical protein
MGYKSILWWLKKLVKPTKFELNFFNNYQFNIDNFQKLRYIEYEKIMIETEDKAKLKLENRRKVD